MIGIIFVSCAKNVEELSIMEPDSEQEVIPAIEVEPEPEGDIEPELVQMQAICELAVMECYYHNVATYHLEDAERFLWITKDKSFWIEYDAVVTLGIDVSKLKMEVENECVRIELPPAEILNCKIESELEDAKYYVAKDSAAVKGEDEIAAFKEAQANLQDDVKKDNNLLRNARNRAKTLLGEYIMNLGAMVGKNYKIEWIELN